MGDDSTHGDANEDDMDEDDQEEETEAVKEKTSVPTALLWWCTGAVEAVT